MGIALSTVIDRIFRDYLTPPDEQPAQTTLSAAITTAAATSVALTDNVLSQEEEDSIGAGTILEADRELMRVTSAAAWPTLTVARGVLGTTAATHLINTVVIVRPKYARQGVFDALADTIEGLNTDLYAVVTSAAFSTTDSLIEVPATVDRILSFSYRNSQYDTTTTRYMPGAVQLLEDLPTTISSTGKAIQLHEVPTGRTGFYVYRKGFTRPDAETYDLTTSAPNFADEWIPLLIFGTLIPLLGGADITTRTQEFVTESMQTQGFPVGSGESISRALIRIYEYLLGKAKASLSRKRPMIVEKNQVVWG